MPEEKPRFTLENVKILPGGFRNFEGRETQFNRKGDRNFNIVLPPELAADLLRDGWNVKTLSAPDDGDPDIPILQVAVSYKNIPPNISVITSAGKTTITEEMVESLDFAQIKTADLICNGYVWFIESTGKGGIKAYLKTLVIVLEEDELDRKWAGVDSSAE